MSRDWLQSSASRKCVLHGHQLDRVKRRVSPSWFDSSRISFHGLLLLIFSHFQHRYFIASSSEERVRWWWWGEGGRRVGGWGKGHCCLFRCLIYGAFRYRLPREVISDSNSQIQTFGMVLCPILRDCLLLSQIAVAGEINFSFPFLFFFDILPTARHLTSPFQASVTWIYDCCASENNYLNSVGFFNSCVSW